jgi:hypothetical protein
MKDQNPFDDHINKRLSEHESPPPEDMFERILRERANRLAEEQDAALRERLDNHASVVPTNMFDKITIERDTRITNDDLQPSLGEKLATFESAVPADMFERIIAERDKRRPVIAWWQSPRSKWAITATLLLLIGSLIGYQSLIQLTTDNGERTMDKGQQTIASSALKTDKVEISQLNQPIIKVESKPETQNLKSKTQNSIKAASNSTNITANFETQNFNQNDVTYQNTPLKTTQLNYNPIIFSESPETNTRSVIVVSPLNGLIKGGVATSPLSHDKAMQAMPCQGPDAGCPTFGPSGIPKTFYIDAYVAPEQSFRSLKPISNEFTDYRNARDTTEKTLVGYSAGVRASVVFDNGIAIRAGAVYAQKNERFRKDSAAAGNIIWKIVEKPNGVRDTLSADYQTGVLRQTRYNRYRTIDFTLQLGYELPIADNLSIGFNAGANINVYNSIKATVLGKDLNAFPLTASNTIYNNAVGVSLVGSIAGYWNFTDRMQLMVEPQFRHYLKPITKNPEYQLQQSYNNLGLAVGVRFRLNRNGLKVL